MRSSYVSMVTPASTSPPGEDCCHKYWRTPVGSLRSYCGGWPRVPISWARDPLAVLKARDVSFVNSDASRVSSSTTTDAMRSQSLATLCLHEYQSAGMVIGCVPMSCACAGVSSSAASASAASHPGSRNWNLWLGCGTGYLGSSQR